MSTERGLYDGHRVFYESEKLSFLLNSRHMIIKDGIRNLRNRRRRGLGNFRGLYSETYGD